MSPLNLTSSHRKCSEHLLLKGQVTRTSVLLSDFLFCSFLFPLPAPLCPEAGFEEGCFPCSVLLDITGLVGHCFIRLT